MELFESIIAFIILLVGMVFFLIIINLNGKKKTKPSSLFQKALLSGICLGLTLAVLAIIAGVESFITAIIFGTCGFFLGAFSTLAQWLSDELYGKRIVHHLIEKLRQSLEG